MLIPNILNRLNLYYSDSKTILKTLTIVDYLLKYGCSGCIDDFKEALSIF
jgi:hypothetical protein